ncbi:MAG: hypothetical protein ACOC9T_01825, partial [Myxococcota bacterium]
MRTKGTSSDEQITVAAFAILAAACWMVGVAWSIGAHAQSSEDAGAGDDERQEAAGQADTRPTPELARRIGELIKEGDVEGLREYIAPEGIVDVMYFTSSCGSYADGECTQLRRFGRRGELEQWLEKAKKTWDCSSFDNDECAFDMLIIGDQAECEDRCCALWSEFGLEHGSLSLSRMCFAP